VAEPARVHAHEHERASRLYELGLKENWLKEAAARGLDARRRCTAFHPPSAPGFYQWAETHVALREILVREGGQADDTGGFSTCISPNGSIAITVATGNERTGKAGLPAPETKYPRGAMTHAAIEVNQQVGLDLETGASILPAEPTDAPYDTWILLLNTRFAELRMELSRPTAIGEDNRVDTWSERILLGPIDIEPTMSIIGPDDDGPLPDVEVLVERK
jgi:hypothetical protein